MKIIQKGVIPKQAKKFICRFCNTIFEAENGEYSVADQMSYLHDCIQYECQCPICKRTATIPT